MSEFIPFLSWALLMLKLITMKTVSGEFKVNRQVSIEKFMRVSCIKNLKIIYVKPVKYGILIRKRRSISYENMEITMKTPRLMTECQKESSNAKASKQ